MKVSVYILVLFFSTFLSFSQTIELKETATTDAGNSIVVEEVEQDKIYTITESPAEFPGGINAMMNFISSNLVYPKFCREMAIGGKVFLKFVVDETGNIISVDVLKSCGVKQMDDEAVRVVKAMPKWKPAEMTGKKVKCYFNLPLSYSISEHPFFVFNSYNKNQKYRDGVNAVIGKKFIEAKKLFEELNDDVDAKFCLGVIYYQYNKKKKAKKLFTEISEQADENSLCKNLSIRFLNNNF